MSAMRNNKSSPKLSDVTKGQTNFKKIDEHVNLFKNSGQKTHNYQNKNNGGQTVRSKKMKINLVDFGGTLNNNYHNRKSPV